MRKLPLITIPLTETKTRVRVRVESDPCEPEERQKFLWLRNHLLQTIADNPSMMDCQLEPFETLKVYHNGDCWVADAEAVISRTENVGTPGNAA